MALRKRTNHKKPRRPALFRYPVKSTDVPVTQTMLFHVRDELKAEISGVRSELKAEISGLRDEFKADLSAEISSVRSELKAEISGVRSELKAEISGVRGEVKSLSHKMTSEFHRLGLLIEEQNARNVFVLDGLRVLFDRQDRIEKQFAKANP